MNQLPEDVLKYLNGRVYYVLPPALQDFVNRRRREAAKAPAEQWMDRAALRNPHIVGFSAARGAIFHPLLRHQPCKSPTDPLQHQDFFQHMIQETKIKRSVLRKKIDWFHTAARAYCGWLLCNQEFLEGHDYYYSTYGYPQASTVSVPAAGGEADSAPAVPGATDAKAQKAKREMCREWQLADLAGPYLPVPIEAQVPVPPSAELAGVAREAGVLLYVPKVLYPVPPWLLLRELWDWLIRGDGVPEHLRGWAKIISSDNQARQSLHRYARLFPLQFYTRVLYARYARLLPRGSRGLYPALAEHFGLDEQPCKAETIRSDFTLLRSKLKRRNWHKPSLDIGLR